ncbi:228_t:CDS:1, partial [Gigaspora margarita]
KKGARRRYSTSEEETESKSDKSDSDEKYEEEVLSSKPYLYWEL